MWPPKGLVSDASVFGKFLPEEVLFEFDGPRTFTVRGAGDAHFLAHQCDEDSDIVRFVVVPCSPRLIDQLKSNQISIRHAIEQPWSWLVDVSSDHSLTAWSVAISDIPVETLPLHDAALFPGGETALRVRFIPDTPHVVPVSLIKTAAERATACVRGIVNHVLAASNVNLSAKEKRQYFDLPVKEIALASFELSMGYPHADNATRSTVVTEMERLLSKGIEWAVRGDDEDVSIGDDAESMAILVSLRQLAPTTKSKWELEIGGSLTGKSKAIFNTTTRNKIDLAIQRFSEKDPKNASRLFPNRVFVRGKLEAIDYGTHRVTVREITNALAYSSGDDEETSQEWPFGDELTVEYTPEMLTITLDERNLPFIKVNAVLSDPLRFTAPEKLVPLYAATQLVVIATPSLK